MFRNDYSELGAKEVLKALEKASSEQNVGYGLDTHSARAIEMILKTFGLDKDKSEVFFLVGGTQTNMTVISYFLRPYECVIGCSSAHINCHETGAVEASGHKVYTVPAEEGKITPAGVKTAFFAHTDEHMVKPRMLYISDTTETGTAYTKEELYALKDVCRELGLLLFLDGARLGVALTLEGTDVTPQVIADVCDIFYVGGTKNGALFGEAVVVKDKTLVPDFRYHIKNRGAMLAKGYAVGIMFEALFEKGLYFSLAENANARAKEIREGLAALGFAFEGTSQSNQIFIRVSPEKAHVLMENYGLELWAHGEGYEVLRIVTSFATDKAMVKDFLKFCKGF